MGIIAYNLFLILYKTGLTLIQRWNPKARLWLDGRKGLMGKIEAAFENRPPSPVIWMHCASLGEFEQGRPVLEKLKLEYPRHTIVLTFFSASGYEVRKDYTGADFVFYLPADSRKNAARFIDIVKPGLVLWVKYEYWYYYLKELKQRQVPVLLLSGYFFASQAFFRWYGKFYRSMLYAFTHIFVQDSDSARLLKELGFSSNVSVSGDTRFDRVIDIAEQFTDIQIIKDFCGTSAVIVAGSTWQEDEEELDHYANTHPEIRFIIAPHEITLARIDEARKLFNHHILFSDLKNLGGEADTSAVNVLIIDNIGMLSRLYNYANITLIGGGFGNDGIHNVLEAAVYGKPVIFGPVYERYIEAVELVELGGAFSVENALELEQALNSLLHNPALYEKACTTSRDYVYAERGATEMIIGYIRDQQLLS